MSMVVLQLPDVKRKTETRPQKCRHCSGETFQRWGRLNKPVRDHRYRTVQVYRYRCCSATPRFVITPKVLTGRIRRNACANWQRFTGCWA